MRWKIDKNWKIGCKNCRAAPEKVPGDITDEFVTFKANQFTKGIIL